MIKSLKKGIIIIMHPRDSIPTFPEFSPISLDMQESILAITSQYPKYHDFSIGNLYCWGTDTSIEICILNDNLVVKFVDYTDESKHFLSYLGNNDSSATAKKLLEFSINNLGTDYLRYVPETSIKSLGDEFVITACRDDFDYIYDLSKYNNEDTLPSYIKPEFNSFINKYGDRASFNTYESIPQELNIAILEIFTTWQSSKQDSNEHEQEKIALTNMINFPQDNTNFWTLVLYDKDKPIGFTINEITHDGEYAIGHFCKADYSYKRIFDFITVEAFMKLSKIGVRYFNMEPDLGIEGLRANKLEKQPIRFLKKYKVKLN